MIEPTISDLAMLVARLIHQVRRFDPDNPVAKQAMDYLDRTDLQRPVLRDIMDRAGLTPVVEHNPAPFGYWFPGEPIEGK